MSSPGNMDFSDELPSHRTQRQQLTEEDIRFINERRAATSGRYICGNLTVYHTSGSEVCHWCFKDEQGSLISIMDGDRISFYDDTGHKHDLVILWDMQSGRESPDKLPEIENLGPVVGIPKGFSCEEWAKIVSKPIRNACFHLGSYQSTVRKF